MKKLMRVLICTAAFALVATAAQKIYNTAYSEPAFSAGDYTDYYYLTLDETEKQAYTAVRQQIYSFPDEISAPTLTKSQLEDVLNALICDDPMMFMLSTCKLRTQGSRAYFIPDYSMNKNEYASYSAEINEILDFIISETDSKSGFDAELFCHDYIVKNCTYSDTDHRDESTVVGALINGKAKCSGYAKALKLLTDSAGLESVLISGKATDYSGNSQNHMWNAVKINKSWYYTDATWDDPINSSGEELCRHIYFNMTEEMLRRTHSEFDFTQRCDDSSLYYYIIYGTYFSSCDSSLISALSSLTADAVLSGKNSVELMFASEALTAQARQYLFESEKVYRALETAALETGLPLVTDSVKYTVEKEENLITIFFDIKE